MSDEAQAATTRSTLNMKATQFITLSTASGPTPKFDRAPPAHAIVHEGRFVDFGGHTYEEK